MIIVGEVTAIGLRNFVREFFSNSHSQKDVRVVILGDDVPGDDVEAILKHQVNVSAAVRSHVRERGCAREHCLLLH